MTIGERIYYCRTENHMTQKQLAEKIGIDPSTLRKYESGRLNPKIGTLRKIADALGCDVADLDENLSAPIDSETMNAIMELANSMSGPKIKDQSAQMEKAVMDAIPPETKKAMEHLANAVIVLDTSNSALPKQISKEAQLLQHFRNLNADGQSVAVDRVEELAQIPKYQRTQSAQQDAPTGADDKTPAKK